MTANQPKRLPTNTEALDGLKLASANARTLLTAADAAAGAGAFGPAAALTVLALEESVKARTLGALAVAGAPAPRVGQPLPAPGAPDAFVALSEQFVRKVVYQGHNERHELGLVQHVITEALQDPAFGATEAQNAQALLQGANRFKQSGLYVDFDPDAPAWTTPGQVTKTEFEDYRALVETFQVTTEQQVSNFR